MHLLEYILLSLAILALAACQDKGPDQPALPADNAAIAELPTQPPSTAEQAAAQETAKEAIKGQAGEEVFNLTREDAKALLNGRFLLTTFMKQTEGIAVPLAEQWKLEKVEGGDGDGRIFTFSSGEWSLILWEPAADAAGVLYHAEISGPDLPRYVGEILADGSVSPAQ